MSIFFVSALKYKALGIECDRKNITIAGLEQLLKEAKDLSKVLQEDVTHAFRQRDSIDDETSKAIKKRDRTIVSLEALLTNEIRVRRYLETEVVLQDKRILALQDTSRKTVNLARELFNTLKNLVANAAFSFDDTMENILKEFPEVYKKDTTNGI